VSSIGRAKSHGQYRGMRECHVSMLSCRLHVPRSSSLPSLEREWSSVHGQDAAAREPCQTRESGECLTSNGYSPADHRSIRRPSVFDHSHGTSVRTAKSTNHAVGPIVTSTLTRCFRVAKVSWRQAWAGRDAPDGHLPNLRCFSGCVAAVRSTGQRA
jgi:hypothetical protein